MFLLLQKCNLLKRKVGVCAILLSYLLIYWASASSLSQERRIWMRQRSQNWNKDWLRNFRMTNMIYDLLCRELEAGLTSQVNLSDRDKNLIAKLLLQFTGMRPQQSTEP